MTTTPPTLPGHVEPRPVGTAAPPTEAAERTFSISIAVSAIRCLLTYVVLPFIAPLIGLAPGVGPVIGITVGTVAIAANVFSIRRFWRSRHRLRYPITALNVAVIVLLVVLIARDVADLVG